MDDSDHNASDHHTRSSLPAVPAPRAVIRAPSEQPLTRRHLGDLADRLRRASRHPAVTSSLATAASLLLHAGLRWALTPQDRSAPLAGSAVTPTRSAMSGDGSLVLLTRTVVVESWIMRDRQL